MMALAYRRSIQNVFKPFFRLDKSRSLNKSGVGLGLAIVEDIINSTETFNLEKANIMDYRLRFLCPFNFFILINFFIVASCF